MRLLLDTHVLLWWLSDDPKLGLELRAAIVNGGNEVFVSPISIAEIIIKQSTGRLQAPRELLELLSENGLTELPLTSAHARELRDLPWYHGEPFDRMLVAQARIDNLVLATADTAMRSYDVKTMRADNG